MSNENWLLQVSPKTPAGTLINVRGNSAGEVDEGLTAVQQIAGNIIATEQILAGAGAAAPLVQEATPAAVPAPAAAGGGAPPAYDPPAPVGAAPAPQTCPHGNRVWRTGSSAKGPWGGHFCPLPKERKSEQCDPVWDRSYGK